MLIIVGTFSTSYAVGAVCSIRPKSSPQDVERFLKLSDLEAEADKPITIKEMCIGKPGPDPVHPPVPADNRPMADQPVPWSLPRPGLATTLRTLLTNHLDIRATPRKSFFEWMRRFTQDEREQERLDEFIADPVSGNERS
jgi:sulfite reductase alpha subunit-like flavoprotein